MKQQHKSRYFRDLELNVNIAGFNIRLNFHDALARTLTKDKISRDVILHLHTFLINKHLDKVDFEINFISDRQPVILLGKKREKSYINFYEKKGKNAIETYYQISIFQFQLLIRLILHQLLLQNNGFMLHASACLINKKANLFLGASGVGKSTMVTLLKNKYLTLTEDTSVVKKEKRDFYFYQTPFIEGERIIGKSQHKYRLGRLFFLKKSKFFKIEKIKNKESVVKLITNSVLGASKDSNKNIKLILNFASCFHHFYFLNFDKDQGKLIELLEKLIKKGD